MTDEDKDLQLYTMYSDGEPIAYAYGEPWVAMALMMNDMQYPTPEAAKEAWEATHGKRPAMTNADRIRAMTDEELAEWLYWVLDCDTCIIPQPSGWLNCRIKDCMNRCLDWLKQEVTE